MLVKSIKAFLGLVLGIILYFTSTTPALPYDPCADLICPSGARVCTYVVEHGFCMMLRID